MVMAVIGVGIGGAFLASMALSVPLALVLGLEGLFWLTVLFALLGMALVMTVPRKPPVIIEPLDASGISMAPVYSSGRLYTADYEGRLTVVDANNGNKVWEQKTEQAFSGGPGLDDERIYMGTIDGRVIAYDRDNGAELWNAQVSSEVLAPPASADGG